MDRSDGVDAVVVVKIRKFDEKQKLLDFHFILFAVEMDDLTVESLGNAASGATSGENIVEESDIERIAFGNACRDITEAVVYMVTSVLLFDLHIVKIALAEGRIGITFRTNSVLVNKGAAKRKPRASTVATLGQ